MAVRRIDLDESTRGIDLRLVGMLPAELRDLVHAYLELRFAAGPGRSSELGRRHGSGRLPPDDPARKALRTYVDSKRKEIGRLAEEIEKRLREVKRCGVCKAENNWDELACEQCGAAFPCTYPMCTEPQVRNGRCAEHQKKPDAGRVRTRPADA